MHNGQIYYTSKILIGTSQGRYIYIYIYVPDLYDLYDLYDLAIVAGWEPQNLTDLGGQVSWV